MFNWGKLKYHLTIDWKKDVLWTVGLLRYKKVYGVRRLVHSKVNLLEFLFIPFRLVIQIICYAIWLVLIPIVALSCIEFGSDR